MACFLQSDLNSAQQEQHYGQVNEILQIIPYSSDRRNI